MQTRTRPSLAGITDLNRLNAVANDYDMRPGWNKAEPSLWTEPRGTFLPARWSWADARAAMDSSAGLISAEQTDRRNLFLVNPLEGNEYATLRTLVSAFQGIMPGERARSHRHAPNALRLVLEGGEGIYTVVDGVRIDMKPGDVVLTPGWCWHGHGNDGNAPGYWIDYLDVPLVHQLEPMFFESWPDGFQAPAASTRDSEYVFSYDAITEVLDAADPDEDGVVRHVLDAPSLPTMELTMSRLGARKRAAADRRLLCNQIITIVEGEGQTVVDGKTFTWTRGDVIAIPRWTWYRHENSSPSVVFTVSDAPVYRKLGFWRHETAAGTTVN